MLCENKPYLDVKRRPGYIFK